MTSHQNSNSDEDTIVVKHRYKLRNLESQSNSEQHPPQTRVTLGPADPSVGDKTEAKAPKIRTRARKAKTKRKPVKGPHAPPLKTPKSSDMPDSTPLSSSPLSSPGSSPLSAPASSPPPPATEVSVTTTPTVLLTPSSPLVRPIRRSARSAGNKKSDIVATQGSSPAQSSTRYQLRKTTQTPQATVLTSNPDQTLYTRWRDLQYHQDSCITSCTCPCFTGNHDVNVSAPPHLPERVLDRHSRAAPLSDFRDELLLGPAERAAGESQNSRSYVCDPDGSIAERSRRVATGLAGLKAHWALVTQRERHDGGSMRVFHAMNRNVPRQAEELSSSSSRPSPTLMSTLSAAEHEALEVLLDLGQDQPLTPRADPWPADEGNLLPASMDADDVAAAQILMSLPYANPPDSTHRAQDATAPSATASKKRRLAWTEYGLDALDYV